MYYLELKKYFCKKYYKEIHTGDLYHKLRYLLMSCVVYK